MKADWNGIFFIVFVFVFMALIMWGSKEDTDNNTAARLDAIEQRLDALESIQGEKP